ncbi:pyridoxamine 5'-phosphate oxidase family protein [Nonomuraea sp. NPDC050153]|uniref:pyridoxamine 5'-phosphate oxidase family protein n=1 Tax=Nonomuraea sp. NPDC050153 TaxID=3364359 RepID=UPI0037B88833
MTGSVRSFLAEPLVATLTTLRPDGSPHVVAVRFTWDGDRGTARVLTVAASRSARSTGSAGSPLRAPRRCPTIRGG